MDNEKREVVANELAYDDNLKLENEPNGGQITIDENGRNVEVNGNKEESLQPVPPEAVDRDGRPVDKDEHEI